MKAVFDDGSFRDPEGRVLHQGDRVIRTLAPSGQKRMERLWADGFIPDLIENELLIPSSLDDAAELGLEAGIATGTVIEHAKVPVVIYPYEWSFDSLREAALITLNLMEKCLDKNLILKDATAFNLMMYEGKLRFIDILSLDDHSEGKPWDGYGQFCQEFLFPLMLTAYKGIDFQPWLRASLGGISASDFARTLNLRDNFRPGILKHVILQARLQRSFEDQNVEVRSLFSQANYPGELILANVKSLKKLVEKFDYQAGNSAWINYEKDHSYSDADNKIKHDFVLKAIKTIKPEQVADLGANTGDYTRLVAGELKHVVAVDSDPACINTLARKCRLENIRNITPIVNDLLNPSPGLGWHHRERKPLVERIRSDAFLALALVHHICISGNVPLIRFIDLLADIAPAGVVEWVSKDDAMVKKLLRNRVDVFAQYTWDEFRAAIEKRFVICDMLETHDGSRKLCLLTAK